MATAFSSFHTPIISSAAPPNPRNRKIPAAAAQSNNWWAPLFGWSSQPDYINNGAKIEAEQAISGQNGRESGLKRPEKGVLRGCFTKEKAKALRKKTIGTTTFHDIMYHPAIAAGLPSQVSGRGDLRL